MRDMKVKLLSFKLYFSFIYIYEVVEEQSTDLCIILIIKYLPYICITNIIFSYKINNIIV